MKYYIKDEIIKPANRIVINKDGFNIINPSEEQILADGWIEYVAPTPTEKELIKEAKDKKINEIINYDTSEDVNSFTYKGLKMWFSKADRLGLKNSMSVEKANGKTTSIMWFNDIPLEVNIDEGLQLLDAIEVYALNCYNITARHKAEVSKLSTIEEINSYNITKDYPKKLEII